MSVPSLGLTVTAGTSIATAQACTPMKADGRADSNAAVAGTDADAQTPIESNQSPDGGLGGVRPPCDLSKPFAPGTIVPGFPFGATWAAGLRLSKDELTGYFFANRSDSLGGNDLYSATRDSLLSPFGGVAPIRGEGINTGETENWPTVTADGLTLFFVRGNPPQTHLYYATRPTTSVPFTYLGEAPALNDPSYQNDTPFLREDGQILYLVSRHPSTSTSDIYRATLDGGIFGMPFPVSELNTTTSDEYAPMVSPDDLTVYFSRKPAGANGGGSSIWMAKRATVSGPFSGLVEVMELNMPEMSLDPTFASSDGCELYYSIFSPGLLDNGSFKIEYVARKPAKE